MKQKGFNFFTALLMILAIFAISSCQDDVTEVVDSNEDQVITSNSTLFDLLGRTTEFDGSFDNILDGASCISIELPVTVEIAGITVILDSEEDFEVLEELFDEFELDIEDIDFVFPITIILSDHSKIVIENEDQLEELVEECVENGDDDDIECLDFKYPIVISVFDTASNVPEVVTIESDRQFLEFLAAIDEDDLLTIQFPITMILYDSTEVTVRSLNDLEALIEDVSDDCDEDDDDDYDEDDVEYEEFVEHLLEGKWEITYFFEFEEQTGLYESIRFKFLSEERVVAYNDEFEIGGEWDADGDEGFIEFELEFPENTRFDRISREWMVLDYDFDFFELLDDDVERDRNSEDSVAYLTFERLEIDDHEPKDSTVVADILIEGDWEVAYFEMTGDVLTELYEGFELRFDEDQNFFATRVNEFFEGDWDVESGDEYYYLNIHIDDDSSIFGDFENEWKVLELEGDRVELKVQYPNNEGYEILVLERIL